MCQVRSGAKAASGVSGGIVPCTDAIENHHSDRPRLSPPICTADTAARRHVMVRPHAAASSQSTGIGAIIAVAAALFWFFRRTRTGTRAASSGTWLIRPTIRPRRTG